MQAARVVLVAVVAAACACAKAAPPTDDHEERGFVSAPNAVAPGAPRRGMAWIPPGVLRAGSAPDEVPRVASAELPGVDVAMAGFYIDVLPWPNEVGAIPTTGVDRDEAQRLCATKQKRLCTELEWERACKGPNNSRYEYGSTFDARVCGVGARGEAAPQRPSGERVGCQSGFSVRDMHGGAWEWTDSRWGRGSTRDLGVVRGGDDDEGLVSSRCAYGRPLLPSDRSPSTGFRCCAGPRNDAEVHLDVKTGPVLERVSRDPRPSPPLDALGGEACGPPSSPAPCWVSRRWIWRPEPNVELGLAGGCIGHWPHARCGLAVTRSAGDRPNALAQIDVGQQVPDVVFTRATERRVRVPVLDAHGHFVDEILFSYGRVDVHAIH